MTAIQLGEDNLIVGENTMTPMVASLLHGAEFLSTAELMRLTQELLQLCNQRQSTDLSNNNIECLQSTSVSLDATAGEEDSLKPIKQNSLLATLATLDPIEEDFPDVDEGLLPLDDIVL